MISVQEQLGGRLGQGASRELTKRPSKHSAHSIDAVVLETLRRGSECCRPSQQWPRPRRRSLDRFDATARLQTPHDLRDDKPISALDRVATASVAR